MQAEIIHSPKGDIARFSGFGDKISNGQDMMDLFVAEGTQTIALEKESIADEFYDLKTGLAGEMLQKISNYGRRLIIIGNFKSIQKKSLRDFIYESNRTGQVVFAENLEEGISKLRQTGAI